MRLLRTGSHRLAVAALVAASLAVPAAGQDTKRGQDARFEFLPAARVVGEPRRAALALSLTDRVTVIASGGKVRSPPQSDVRRLDAPGGRTAGAKAARLGVVFRW